MIPLLLANSLWLCSGVAAARGLRRALQTPLRAQEDLLLSILRANQDCEYGKRHGFSRIRSVRDYQTAVPIVSYGDLEEDIDAVKKGRSGVLTSAPVVAFEKTTGSSAAAKYIPYTAALKRQFRRAVAAWMIDLYSHHPAMMIGKAYWSVSPAAREREVTPGGLPVGFDDETEYFGGRDRWLLRRILAAPPELPAIPDLSSSRYVTLRFLLEEKRLAFVSVWNPSFLTLLIRYLLEHAERLIEDVRRGQLTPPVPLPDPLRETLCRRLRANPERAAELERAFEQPARLVPSLVWPGLAVVSCWTSAGAKLFVPEMREFFPHAVIQPKGLIATEGVVSIPLTGHAGAAPALTSHFLEFIDGDRPGATPLLAHKLTPGKTYSVVLTTGGGLYRYRLGDRVQVVGRILETPLVEFIGKEDLVSDLCGEKLHEAYVRKILRELFEQVGLRPSFAMMAPEWGRPPGYVLFVEAPGFSDPPIESLGARLEARLKDSPHYRYCRELGQLAPARAVLVSGGAARIYLERCLTLGQRAGDVKPTALHCATGWRQWFRPAGADVVAGENP